MALQNYLLSQKPRYRTYVQIVDLGTLPFLVEVGFRCPKSLRRTARAVLGIRPALAVRVELLDSVPNRSAKFAQHLHEWR